MILTEGCVAISIGIIAGKTMLPYVILYQLLVIHVSVSIYVEVPVFSKYTMPCNISHLPKTPDLQKFVWYQDGRINRAINEIILSYGEIPFGEITPDASGTYMCCYGTSNFSFCAEKIRLYVECNCELAYFVVCLWISAFSYLHSVSDPRPKIFFDTILNTTAPVYTDTVYWLPQMLTTPLEHPNIAKSNTLVNFHCFYYVNSTGTRRPDVEWSFNDRLPAGKHFEKIIDENTTNHKIYGTEIPCEEEYMKGNGSHCFQSTLTIRVNKSNTNQRATFYTCYVSISNGYERNILSVNYRLGNESRLSDMRYFNKGCYGNLNKTKSLKATIQQLNACERNQFLGLWVSPAEDGNSAVECSRPLFVVFDEGLQVMRLPADLGLVKMFAQLEALRRSEKFYSNLDKCRQRLLVSSRLKARLQDRDLYFYDATIEGNVSLGCQADQVVVVCTYGPLFQMKLVSTGCKRLGCRFLLYCPEISIGDQKRTLHENVPSTSDRDAYLIDTSTESSK
ncbi:hypothetical protein ACTXT7_003082 [Hymenolepis weldensis]